jgi:predicted DCC family thiol-disulfide oxidoreductase YuxK
MLSASFEDELLDEEASPVAASARKKTARKFGRSHFIGLLVAGAVVWAVFAWALMPRLISDAYAGHGVSMLVRQLEHKHAYPLEHYLHKWNKAAILGLGAWIGAGAVMLLTTSRWFLAHAVRTATPGTLGAMRALICIILAWVTYWMRLREMAILPDAQRISMGVMDFFYKLGFAHVVHNVPLVQTLKWLCFALCIVGAVGYRTKVVLPLIALLYLPLAGITRSYFWFNHCGLVPWYCLLVLCIVPSHHGFSVDRLMRIARNLPVPPADVATARYGWARLAVWLCICIPYMCAGLSKLHWGSIYWWDANNMQYILFADGLRPGGETLAMKFLWLPGWFFALMGIGTIITEVGFITVPLFRLPRMLLPISMFGMHLGIWTLMGINFYDLLIIQVIFYDWSPAVRWISAKLAAKRGHITVLYDGSCPLCRRTIRVVRAMDILHRINPIDFRTANVAALASKHRVTLDPSRLDREMVVIQSGEAFGGARGARVVAGAIPALWLAWPLLATPGLSNVASVVYQTVARNRMSLLKCEPDASGACAIDAPEKPVRPAQPVDSWRAPMWGLGPAVAVALAFCLQLAWWSTKIEWYPLTGMQMFTWYNVDENGKESSVVDYYRAYAVYEDGTTEIARFDKMGGGIARYKNTLEAPFLKKVPPEVTQQGRLACIALMKRSAAYYNANLATPGKRIVRMETHHKQWDFVKERHDTVNWGKTVGDPIAVDIPIDPAPTRIATNAK